MNEKNPCIQQIWSTVLSENILQSERLSSELASLGEIQTFIVYFSDDQGGWNPNKKFGWKRILKKHKELFGGIQCLKAKFIECKNSTCQISDTCYLKQISNKNSLLIEAILKLAFSPSSHPSIHPSTKHFCTIDCMIVLINFTLQMFKMLLTYYRNNKILIIFYEIDPHLNCIWIQLAFLILKIV